MSIALDAGLVFGAGKAYISLYLPYISLHPPYISPYLPNIFGAGKAGVEAEQAAAQLEQLAVQVRLGLRVRVGARTNPNPYNP